MSLLRLAQKVEFYLKHATPYPDFRSVAPIIKSYLESSPLEDYESLVEPIEVKTDTINAVCSVYFQVILEKEMYNKFSDPNLYNSVQYQVSSELSSLLEKYFKAFQFKVKFSIVPKN